MPLVGDLSLFYDGDRRREGDGIVRDTDSTHTSAWYERTSTRLWYIEPFCYDIQVHIICSHVYIYHLKGDSTHLCIKRLLYVTIELPDTDGLRSTFHAATRNVVYLRSHLFVTSVWLICYDLLTR